MIGLILAIVAIFLAIWGVLALLHGALIWGIILLVLACAIGPGGWSVWGRDRNRL